MGYESSWTDRTDRESDLGHMVVSFFGAPKWFGYGSIAIDTFLVGWTSIYQLFWCSLGTRVLTHPHLNGQSMAIQRRNMMHHHSVSLGERWNFIELNRVWFAYQGIPGEDFMRYPFFSHAIMIWVTFQAYLLNRWEMYGWGKVQMILDLQYSFLEGARKAVNK